MPPKKDQKTEHSVWQSEDGDGDPNPETIEGHRKGGNLHPTWKLFMGEVPAGVTADKLAIPRYCYLDDKAAWVVSKIPDLQKHDRRRYWPYDFTETGSSISTNRPNCGRPAYNHYKKLASIQRGKGRRYWLCGSGVQKAPIPESAPPLQEDGGNGHASTTSESSETGDPSIEPSAELRTGVPQERTPEDANLEGKSKEQTPGEPKPKKKFEEKPMARPEEMPEEQPEEIPKEQPEEQPKEHLGYKPKEERKEQADETEENKQTPQVDTDAKTPVQVRRRTPLTKSRLTPGLSNSSTSMQLVPHYPSLTPGGSNTTTPFTEHPKARSSSSPGSSKRSASPTGTSTSSKRQRSRLQSYNLPPEVKQRDDEVTLLQSRVTKLQACNAQLVDEKRKLSLQVANLDSNMRKHGNTVANTKKERDTFHQAAMALHTYILDKQDELAECHSYCVGLVERERELQRLVGENAALARRALKPLESKHRGLGQVLDDQEERFKEAGLERVWEESMGEEKEQ